ncbi:MAG: hypothetical protein LBS32_04250 [Clostridiales Family XIII bacterium]|jgi:hypothetical protein|nr:hypothetical protein [Clostridiales Family XIII bacterium]
MKGGKPEAGGIKRIHLMFTIVDRGMGDEVERVLRESGVTYNMTAPGYGASGLALADILGLTDFERDIVISVVREDRAHDILDRLRFRFDLGRPDSGIAFTIPISGVSGPLALKYISGH